MLQSTHQSIIEYLQLHESLLPSDYNYLIRQSMRDWKTSIPFLIHSNRDYDYDHDHGRNPIRFNHGDVHDDVHGIRRAPIINYLVPH